MYKNKIHMVSAISIPIRLRNLIVLAMCLLCPIATAQQGNQAQQMIAEELEGLGSSFGWGVGPNDTLFHELWFFDPPPFDDRIVGGPWNIARRAYGLKSDSTALLYVPSPFLMSENMARMSEDLRAAGLYLAIVHWFNAVLSPQAVPEGPLKIVLDDDRLPGTLPSHLRSTLPPWKWKIADVQGQPLTIDFPDSRIVFNSLVYKSFTDFYDQRWPDIVNLGSYFTGVGVQGLIQSLVTDYYQSGFPWRNAIERMSYEGWEHNKPKWQLNPDLVKQYFAAKYFHDRLAPLLRDHFQDLYAAARDRAASSLTRAMRELSGQRVKINADLIWVQSAANDKRWSMPTPEIEFEVRSGYDGSGSKEVRLGTTRITRNTFEIFFPLLGQKNQPGLLPALYRRSPVLTFYANGVKDPTKEFLVLPRGFLLRPRTDGHGKALRFEVKANQGLGFISQVGYGPLKVIISHTTVVFRIVDEFGQPAPGARVEGPGGATYTADAQGNVTVPVPIFGRSIIALLDDKGQASGDFLIVENGKIPAGSLGPNVNKKPLPSLPSINVQSFENAAVTWLDRYDNGLINHDEAHEKVMAAMSAADEKIQIAELQWKVYVKVYLFNRRDESAEERERARKHLDQLRLRLFSPKTLWSKKRADLLARLATIDERLNSRVNRAFEDVRASNERLSTVTSKMFAHLQDSASIGEQAKRYQGKICLGERYAEQHFTILEEVETERQRINKLREDLRTHAQEIKALMPQIEAKITDLEVELEILASVVEMAGSQLANERRPTNTKGARVMMLNAAGLFTTNWFEVVDGILERNDQDLAWLQLRALEQSQRISEVDALSQRVPFTENEAIRFRPQIGNLDTVIIDMWDDIYRIAIKEGGGSGYGVDAYEHHQQALPLFSQLKLQIDSIAEQVSAKDGWINEIKDRLAALGEENIAANNTFCRIAEMMAAIGRAHQRGSQALSTTRSVVEPYLKAKTNMEATAESKTNSPLEHDFNWVQLLADNLTAIKLLEQAKPTQDLVGAQQLLDRVEALIKPHRDMAGRLRIEEAPGRIVPIPKELYMLKRLDFLWATVANQVGNQTINRRGSIEVELNILAAASTKKLEITLTDSSGNHLYLQPGGVQPLEPGPYTLTANGPGIEVQPDRLTFTLAAQEIKKVRLTIRSTISSNQTNTTVSGNVSVAAFTNVKEHTLATGFNSRGKVPLWSADSKSMVVEQAFNWIGGLFRLQVQDRARTNLITGKIEAPYPISNDRLREMEWSGGQQPFLLNDQVLYRMPSTYNHAGGRTSLVYRIVPLAGGTPKEFFELSWYEEATPQ
ncbi:hypothetical protein ACFLT9_12965, partial [Acidobacteriota bacterium]